MNSLLRREVAGPAFRELWKKYFENDKRMAELRAEESTGSGRISPFDDLVRRVARRHGLDWRLVLAQMYQESRFDPKARSWAGAVGLLQVMPRTGRELGFRNLEDPESNIRAGVKYLAQLISRTDRGLPMRQRIRFALAGYNAGMGHVQDARRLARRRGLDPDRWFGNVEEAMLLLEKPDYYSRAQHGYCRGREPKAYVSRIQSKYDGYVSLMPADGRR
jgi:membrane-bound lytic murein transglycosylase F